VVATDDLDALVALGADCVVYTSQAEMRPTEAIDEISRFLAAGTNVVGTSMVWLVAPEQADDWLRDPLQKACKAATPRCTSTESTPGSPVTRWCTPR
jgi:hypothetical protein